MSVSNVIPSRGSSSMIPPYLRRHLISSSFIALLFTLLCVIFLYGSRSPSEILRSTKSPIDPIRLSDPSTLSASGSKPEASRITLPDLPEDPYAEHFPNLRLPDSLLEYPLLAQKLYDFLVRPISNYTSEYVLEQHLLCPPRLSDNLVNPDQYKGERDSWLEISAREIAYRRAVVVNWLENRLLRGEPIVGTESTGLGRGIVLAGGNKVRRSLSSSSICKLTWHFGAGHDI